MEIEEKPELYTPLGCEKCNHSGYAGRTGVYELVPIDTTLQQMIHDSKGELEMEKYARSFTSSLRIDGRRLVLEGTTSLEEVLRVSRDD